jgi:PAS domain-containing protein
MFRLLAENFPNGVIALLDKNLRIIYTDGTGFVKEGLNPREFEGMLYPQMFDKVNEQIILKELNEVLQGQSSIFQLTYGGRVYLVSAVALDSEAYKEGRIILSTFDISEQSKAEEQVYFQAEILQNIKESVAVTDSTGIITYWNGGAESILGFPAQEVIGKNIKQFYPESAAVSKKMRQHLINHGQISDEINLKNRDGESVWIFSKR